MWYVPSNLLVLDIDARGRVLLTGNEANGVTAGVTTVNGTGGLLMRAERVGLA